MAIVTGTGEDRSKAGRSEEARAGAFAARLQRPSIREVCLLGMETPRLASAPATPTQGAWDPGGRLRWSGRSYRVEATQVRRAMAGGEAIPASSSTLRYVHLSALAEG